MQKRVWQREDIDRDFQCCESFKEMIEEAEKKIWEKGEVICQVTVNDKVLSERDERSYGGSSKNFVQSLKILSETPHRLRIQTLESLLELCQQLKSQSEEISRNLLKGDVSASQSQFVQFSEAFEDCAEGIRVLRQYRDSATRGGTDDSLQEQWGQQDLQVKSTLSSLLKGYQAQDWVEVADLLEDEVIRILQNWTSLLKKEKYQ